jgi:hypothetical protein
MFDVVKRFLPLKPHEVPEEFTYNPETNSFRELDLGRTYQLGSIASSRIVLPTLPAVADLASRRDEANREGIGRPWHTPLNPARISIGNINSYAYFEQLRLQQAASDEFNAKEVKIAEATAQGAALELDAWWLKRLDQNAHAMKELIRLHSKAKLNGAEIEGLMRLSAGVGSLRDAAFMLSRVPEMGGIEVGTSLGKPFSASESLRTVSVTKMLLRTMANGHDVEIELKSDRDIRPYKVDVPLFEYGSVNTSAEPLRTIIVRSNLGSVGIGRVQLDVIRRGAYIALTNNESVPGEVTVSLAGEKRKLAVAATSVYLRHHKST